MKFTKFFYIFAIVFVVLLGFASCKDKEELAASADNTTEETVDYQSVYKEAMSDMVADFDLKAYQSSADYRQSIDANAEAYVAANAEVFGNDVLVLSSADLGENGEGLSAMLSELNAAQSEGAESLERAYAKLRQRKPFRSPSIEMRIAEERMRSPRRSAEMEGESNVDENEELGELEFAEIDEPEEDLITVEDLADDRGILVVGTTVNIFLEDSVQMAVPVPVFNEIVAADPSILTDLEQLHASKQQIRRRGMRKENSYWTDESEVVSDSQLSALAWVISKHAGLLGHFWSLYITSAHNLMKNGWEVNTKKINWHSEWMMYVNFSVDRFVVNNGNVSVLLCIYLQNRYRNYGIRSANDPIWQWMKYKYTFSIYGNSEDDKHFEQSINTWTNIDLFKTGSPNTALSLLKKQKEPTNENDFRTEYECNTSGSSMSVPNFHIYESFTYKLPASQMAGQNRLRYGFETLWIEARNYRGCYLILNRIAKKEIVVQLKL